MSAVSARHLELAKGADWVQSVDPKWIVTTDAIIELKKCRIDRAAVHGQIRPLDSEWVVHRMEAVKANHPKQPVQVIVVQADASGMLTYARVRAHFLSSQAERTG
jgi:hypothetical protein